MRRLLWNIVLLTLCLSATLFTQEQPPTTSTSDAPVFREPFTLKLRVDKDHYYEEHYERLVPYVAQNDIYLFSGEQFGVNVSVQSDEIVDVTYQPDVKKADVEFKFSQEQKISESAMMLVIQNKLKRKLYMDGLMTIPGKKGVYKTSILPIEAGLSDYESWPHPVVQLVLRNLRLSEKPAEKSAK